MIHANLCQTDPRVPCRDLDLQGNPWNTPDPRSASCPAPAVHAWSAQRPASEPWKPRWPAARTNTTERHMGDRQNAIQQNPVLSRKVSVLGVRCIGLHGLVCHAVTFACWFEFKPWGWGWLVVSLQKRGASFRIVLKRIFRCGLVDVEHPESVDTANIHLFHIIHQQGSGSPFHAFVCAWKFRTTSFSSPGIEWVLVHPGIQKSISGYRLGIGLGIGLASA